MKATRTDLGGLIVIETRAFPDDRGFFTESWNASAFAEATGVDVTFVQDNHSRSSKGVLRGLHYQLPEPQAKLVRCTAGSIWDVAVDIRQSSPTFGQWFGLELSGDDHRQLWVPAGFAHGFVVLSDVADVLYKVTEYFSPEHDRGLRWNDPAIGIAWPISEEPLLSDKDASAPILDEAVLYD